jgi:CheY-like chemotaxis protein
MAEPKLHIMLIDDDRLQVHALKKIVENTGLAGMVSIFADGKEAVDYLTEQTQLGDTLPDVIFLDINMPVMNAWKFLEAYSRIKRRLYRPIAVYVVTSSTSGVDMAHSRHFDTVKGYITKPVTKDKIYQVLSGIAAM